MKRQDAVGALEQRLGIKVKDRATALMALTHKSYVNEHREDGLVDNERLEFLGDAVIDLAVSHRLMEKLPAADEGALSKLRAAVVNEDGLAVVAAQIHLGELLLLGRGEEMSGGRDKPSLLANAFEAVIGAIYLEGGIPAVLALVDRLFGATLELAAHGAVERDYKTQLQELAQSRFGFPPSYRVIDEEGPDHSKIFTVELEISGRRLGSGVGRSKKDAEQAAAREGFDMLRKEAAADPHAPVREPKTPEPEQAPGKPKGPPEKEPPKREPPVREPEPPAEPTKLK